MTKIFIHTMQTNAKAAATQMNIYSQCKIKLTRERDGDSKTKPSPTLPNTNIKKTIRKMLKPRTTTTTKKKNSNAENQPARDIEREAI